MTSFLKAVLVSALAVFGIRTEEQPPYAIVDQLGPVEVRKYGPRVVAEVSVEDRDEQSARREAFGILAGYIFGKNREKTSIDMTAPVATARGRQIEMTAPVQTLPAQSNQMKMRFYLPSGITAANAPVPQDARVRLTELPGETVAALRFSGSWSEAAFSGKRQELIAKLATSHWKAVGQPFSLFYDPPFTIPFLRRNEAAVQVEPLDSGNR